MNASTSIYPSGRHTTMNMAMQLFRRFAPYSLIILLNTAALAQSTNYTSVEATSDKPIQLSYHASARKNCTPAPLPMVRVLEPPKFGTLIVRKAQLTTDKITNCPALKIPAQVIFYQARNGYLGHDHVIYAVADENGEVNSYDVTINVKEASKTNAPNKDSKI
jgi:hypothetical protein